MLFSLHALMRLSLTAFSPGQLFLRRGVLGAADFYLHLLQQVSGLPDQGVDMGQLRSLLAWNGGGGADT